MTRRSGQETARAECRHQLPVLHLAFQSQQQADAADFLEDARIVGNNFSKLEPEQVTHAGHVTGRPVAVQKVRSQHHVEDRVPHGHGQGRAAERRSMAAGFDRVGNLGHREHDAERITRTDSFARRDDVGGDAGRFEREQFAGAAESRLHLVEQQQQAVLVAHLPNAHQHVVGKHANAAFALDWLEQDRGGLGSDRGAQRGQVAEGHVVEAGNDRFVALRQLRLAAGGDRRHGASMEGIGKADDAPASGRGGRLEIAAHELQRKVDRLAARVREKRLVGEARGANAIGETLLAGNADQVRCVPERVRLFAQRVDQRRMAMPQRVDRDTGEKVEIAVALGVV